MKYAIGGISGKTGEKFSVEVPLQGVAPKPQPRPAPAPAPKPAQAGGGDEPLVGPNGKDPDPPKAQARPGYDLLPDDLKARYLKASFTAEGEQIQISLEHLIYQNLGLNERCFMDTKNVLVGLFNEAKKKDPAFLETLGEQGKGGPTFIMHAFSGKGSPEQHQACLKIAAHYPKRLGRDWKDMGSLSASLNTFYFSFMGLDCSGFAGNYARAIGTKLEPNSPIPSFAPPNMRRTKVDDILGGDVIIWGKRHIATIQGRRPDGNFDIVEANDEPEVLGLGYTVREIKETGTDSLKIRKLYDGKPRSSTFEDVYVATLK